MGLPTHPANSPGGDERDANDFARLRHGRNADTGLPIGQYLQPAPLLFTRDGHNVFLGDMYRGRSAFLICGGPSLTTHNLALLQQRGVLTMAVNNAATVVRPQLWCAVDDPGNFHESIWLDPAITKFVPLGHMEKRIQLRAEQGGLVESPYKVGDLPAVFGFRRNEAFVAEQFLREDTINWGNHGKRVDAYGRKGTRSVMYVAFRLLHYLGVRQVYLLGCDFRMEVGRQNYAFDQDRSPSSVRGNNSIYATLNVRLGHLQPHFEQAGFRIANCTSNSGLTVFPHIDFEEAVHEATASIPRQLNTAGMYDRQARERAQKPPTVAARPQVSSLSSAAVNWTKPAVALSAESLRRLPSISLIVPVCRRDVAYLKQSWPTWMHFKPWLKELPTHIVCSDDVGKVEGVLTDHPSATLHRLESEEAQCWETDALNSVLNHVQSDWYLLLSPKAVATAPTDWLSSDVFQAAPSGTIPAFSSCRWGYTKRSGVFQELDAWADQIEALAKTPPLGWGRDRPKDRLDHPAIAAWSFLGNTVWSKQVLAHAQQAPPPAVEWSTFALYCAERTRTPFLRLPIKELGWDHSFGWTVKSHAARCIQALSSKEG